MPSKSNSFSACVMCVCMCLFMSTNITAMRAMYIFIIFNAHQRRVYLYKLLKSFCVCVCVMHVWQHDDDDITLEITWRTFIKSERREDVNGIVDKSAFVKSQRVVKGFEGPKSLFELWKATFRVKRALKSVYRHTGAYKRVYCLKSQLWDFKYEFIAFRKPKTGLVSIKGPQSQISTQ